MSDTSDMLDAASAVTDQQTAMAVEQVLLRSKTKWSTHCDLCDEPLSEFRQTYGRCITCQEIEEKREKAGVSRRFMLGDND